MTAPTIVRKQLILDFLDQVDESADGLTTEVQLNPLISVLHSLREFPILYNDLELLDSIFRKMNTLLYNMLRKSDRYSRRVAAHTLYLKEVTYSFALIEQTRNETEKEFQNKWDKFYFPLLRKSIKAATDSIYYIVNYHRTTEDARSYLFQNIDILMNYLDSTFHWKHAKRIHNIELVTYFGKQLLYTSIFIFRKYYYFDKILAQWVNEFGCKIADNAFESGSTLMLEPDEILDQLLSDPNYSYDAPFEQFEDPDIVVSATHIGGVYDFSHFWILFGLYRNSTGKSFLPKNITSTPNGIITELRQALDSIDKEKIRVILRWNKGQLEEYLNLYRRHLSRQN